MNAKNLEFLKDGLKYMGFGDKLNGDLEAKIKEQPTEFHLAMQGEFKKGDATERVDYMLNFKKSDQTDMYFFNRYQATLKNDDQTKEKAQTFYITKNTGITAKEAFNLLGGRAVNKDLTNKEGQSFNAWLQIDFTEKDKNANFKVKQFHAAYGYELDKVLSKFPIKELADTEQKEKMIKSLEKGNTTSATFHKDGKEEKMFLEANPQFKTLIVYDVSMKKTFQENEKKITSPELDRSQSRTKESKSEMKITDESNTQKKSRRKGISV